MKALEISGPQFKKNALYYLLIFPLIIGFAFISFTAPSSAFFFCLIRILQLFGYCALGLISLNFAKKRFLLSNDVFPQLSAVLYITTLLILLILYLLLDKSQLFISLSSSAAFILPFAIFYCYNIFISIPAKQNKIWYPSYNKPIVEKAIVYVNSAPLNLKLKPKFEDKKLERFETVVPVQMALGAIFQVFLVKMSKENNQVDLVDENGQEVGWVFFNKTFLNLYSRSLLPTLNVWENNIKPHSTVVAKRVKVSKVNALNNARNI